MIITSGIFYNRIPEIQEPLEALGHEIKLPNSYGEKFDKMALRSLSDEKFANFKEPLLRKNKENIESQDAVLVLNLDKDDVANYIGGATFLEIYEAWRMKKKIYIYNELPQNIFLDELRGMRPVIINGNLGLIK